MKVDCVDNVLFVSKPSGRVFGHWILALIDSLVAFVIGWRKYVMMFSNLRSAYRSPDGSQSDGSVVSGAESYNPGKSQETSVEASSVTLRWSIPGMALVVGYCPLAYRHFGATQEVVKKNRTCQIEHRWMMKSWAASQARWSKFKRKACCLLVLPLIVAALSAQVSLSTPDLPASQQVIDLLTESIDWYRHCAIEQQIATDPADFVFVEDNHERAAQIVQLSFDFARSDAQFSATHEANAHKGSATAVGSPEVRQFLQLQNNTELQMRQASEQIEAIKTKLQTAHHGQRGGLQAALDTTQSRLDVLQAGLATLGQLVEFMQAGTGQESGDLASSIEQLARTVPDVSSPMPSASQKQALSLPLPSKPADSGILALSSEVTVLGKKLRILDDEIHRTNDLRQSSDELRNPLLAALNKRLPAVAETTLEAANPAELQQQKTKLDELATLVKALSPAIVALDKQRVLLSAYTAHLNSWRAAVIAEDKKTWMNLITRLVGAAVVIGALLIIGAVARKVTRRQMRDTDRRHIVLVLLRVVLWATIVVVAAFAFASDLTSLATFLGLLAAGVAVALQNVIVAALAYFVLVGRRGIRLGDRLEISGVAGDVTDIGWLQFQLREVDKATRQPTGRIVTFSNSFVFLSPATALSRFSREEAKSQLEIAAKASKS